MENCQEIHWLDWKQNFWIRVFNVDSTYLCDCMFRLSYLSIDQTTVDNLIVEG